MGRGGLGGQTSPGVGLRAGLKLATADQAWLVAFALANLVPLLFWSRVEAWAHGALVMYAGR